MHARTMARSTSRAPCCRKRKATAAGALASYDRLAQSPDRLVHARAAVRAVELRLAIGAIDARQAADGLERLLYAWRGDRRERALRERLAELEARTGAWRAALALLRESETLFPDDKAAIHAELDRHVRRAAARRYGGHAGSAGAGVAGGRELRTCCRPARMARPCRRSWPTGWWRWICRNAPGRCWRS